MSLEFYIVDVETTGLSSKIHEICEISIIRCSDKIQLTEFIKCENPETASIDALRITNKTMADLSIGNSKEYVADKIDRFLSSDNKTPAHRCFVAHNDSFDRRMIHALYEKLDRKCPVDLWVCSMALTKEYAKKNGIIKPKVNLDAACNLLEIKKLRGAHASKVDARNTFFLWKKLIEDKQIDYLPFIKTSSFEPSTSLYNGDVDMSIIEGYDSGDTDDDSDSSD